MRDICLFFSFNNFINLLLLALFLGEANSNAAKQSGEVYIVYLGAARKDHAQLVSRLLMKREKESLVHTYGKSFSGFAAHLSNEEAESIARQPEVVSVFREQASKHHTTRSWDFLMSQNAYSSKYESKPMISSRDQRVSCSIGADTIIGVIDSGIWPEHPSFDDKLMGPVPTRWKGECKPGNSSIPVRCNRKLIGARYYNNATARDSFGHGTHVASTAAGNLVEGASYKGIAGGIARGGSPCSRIAAYNADDADYNSPDSYILKAFDDAIDDGVDVLSISIGSERDDFLTDPIAIGAFHAMEKGITVVCSAGNSGSAPGALENFAPWILSVGATTIDRVFEISIVLGGRHKRRRVIVKGSGMYFGGLKKTVVYPLTDGINCVPGSLDDAKVKGKIILCDSKEEPFVSSYIKFATLKKQGAIGVISVDVFSYLISYDYSDIYQIPFASVSDEDGAKIQFHINSTSNPLATLLPTITTLNHKPAPVVAFFSSRGPGMSNLIKPDVAAPGVNIIAGVPPITKDGRLFDIKSGTSMSCPHVSGVAAMIKSVHPTWSLSAIRSAITTTAIHTDSLESPIKTDFGSVATPYDMGAGEINPIGSLWPGLVYETSTADYIQFLCNMGYNTSAIRIISSAVLNNFCCPPNSNPDLISDMNYPSIAVSGLRANVSRTVKRTVTNVGEAYSTYTATLVAPTNVQVQVVPNTLQFTKNVKTLTFQVTFKPTTTSDEDMFGSITWCNWKYKVRSPFVVSKS